MTSFKRKFPSGTSEDSGIPWEKIYQRNAPWIERGKHTYNTSLPPQSEKEFRKWVKKNKVSFDVHAELSDYDMRGFWLALTTGNPRAQTAIDPNDKRLHFPDYWKTPYDATFSNQSKWAVKSKAPHWTDDDKLVTPAGKVIWDDRARNRRHLSKSDIAVNQRLSGIKVLPSRMRRPQNRAEISGTIGDGALTDLKNMIRQEVERDLRNFAEPRCGLVSATDGPPMCAKVLVQPENVESGWLPISVDWMGNGWGIVAPLSVNDQVLVVFQEASRDSGIIVKRLWDQRNAPPSQAGNAQSGEYWLVHKSGSIFKLTNDGKVTLSSQTEADIDAPSVKVGNLAAGLSFLVRADTFFTWVNAHTHGGGAPPDTKTTSSMQTSALEAN